MVDWPATLDTVGTLIAGGVLTMAGQALADRRARRRDREARRETFLVQNYFAVQQEALMKTQELVDEFSRKLNEECLCIWFRLLNDHLSSTEAFAAKAGQSHGGRLSADQQVVQFLKSEKFGTDYTRYYNSAERRTLRGSLISASNLYKEYDEFSSALRVKLDRVGSQSVETAARSYLKAAFAELRDVDDSENSEWEAKTRLRIAISKALQEGPFVNAA